MSYNGLMALQVGFLVAFTQLIPEHQVQLFGGLFKIRVKVSFLCNLTAQHSDNALIWQHVTVKVATDALRDGVKYSLLARVPIPVHSHSIWMVHVVVLSTIRQDERRGR